jgi:ATP-dependent DNA ligase
MALSVPQSLETMDAKLVAEIPTGDQWQYEPKWDGFRCLLFRNGDHVELRSRSGQPLSRYFPELVAAAVALNPKRFVLDGEIVIPTPGEGGGLSFDDLLQRIHPAASRVRKLSLEHPATFIAFDLLADEQGKPLTDHPLEERRPRLEAFAGKHLKGRPRFALSPATRSIKTARDWFAGVGGSLDGVIAKRLDLPYQSGNRDGMVKVKRMRTADCVIGGFRYASKGNVVGSLLLGLYGDDGLLHHVGFCSTIKNDERKRLTAKLKALIEPPGFTGRAPGGPSRWSTERSTEWQPLRPELVIEVRYDHFTAGRFRHGTKLLRWRPDKAPRQCRMKQVERESAAMLLKLA